MALPKRRFSKARRDKRRANWKFAPPTLTVCTHCGAPVAPHHICLSCGYYRGRQVLVVASKEGKGTTRN